ncbi:serine protease [Myxococcus sp. K15C18031901]|uniref:S1C family serine protease n=1 Tax=Myxococcus dinghuensis TaxID=2906761 RepID=UPI0020A7D5B2|nr:serine protease [Myxococcus dinghuensis]MCP3099484.1 serine protease [Myxococcus dinghuensis]
MARVLPSIASSLVLFASGASHAEELAAFAARVKPSIVSLEVIGPGNEPIGSGTGFFISEDGLVATNNHVVNPAEAIDLRAQLSDGTTRKVLGIMARNPERDIAMVKLEGDGYPALPLAGDTQLQEGTKVLSIGNPLGLTFTLAEGIVSALRPDGVPDEEVPHESWKKPLIQFSINSDKGASGSPIMTEDGQVIAVLKGGYGFRGTFMGIPAVVVSQLKERLAPEDQPQAVRAFPVKGAIGSAIFFGVIALVWAWPRRHGWRRAARPAKARADAPRVRSIDDYRN